MKLARYVKSVYESQGVYELAKGVAQHLIHHPGITAARAKRRWMKYRYYSNYDIIANPLTIIYTDPGEIKVVDNSDLHKMLDSGKIISGNWDRNVVPIEQHPKFRAVKERYTKKKSWEDTGIYDHLMMKINSRGRAEGCHSLVELKERYESVDILYESMRNEGYQSSKVGSFFDHICVHIGRDGELIFAGGGTHRLAIAQVLGLPEVPVRVVVRHKKWQDTRDKHCQSGDGVEKLDHPDIPVLN